MAKLLIGNLRPPIATTTNPGISKPDGTTIGVNSEGTLSSLVKASGLNVTDTQGMVVPKVEEVAQETTMQALIDAVADKVMNQLVSNATLTTTLADYVTKAMIKTEFEDSDETVPASSLVNQLNSDLQAVESKISIAKPLSSANLNDIVQSGFYIQNINNNATIENNYPVAGISGLLEVFRYSDTWLYQRYSSYQNKVYIRNKYSGWDSWREL